MTNFHKHSRAWVRFWCAWDYNESKGNDKKPNPWCYDWMRGLACLCDVHTRAEIYAKNLKKRPDMSLFKEARAAMAAFWSIQHPQSSFAEEKQVKLVAKGLRAMAPSLARYSDTWNVSLIWDKIIAMSKEGIDLMRLPHAHLRKWVVMLLKLRTGARTSDLAGHFNELGHLRGGLYRGWFPSEETLEVKCGLRGDPSTLDVSHVRWFMNKTIIRRPAVFSAWFAIGDKLKNTPEEPFLETRCVRSLLQRYLTLTTGLTRGESETNNSVFVIAKKNVYGIVTAASVDTLRNDCKKVMKLCGVPKRFLPHSTRHASLSFKTDPNQQNLPVAKVLHGVDMTTKTFTSYYQQPISSDVASPPKDKPSAKRRKKGKPTAKSAKTSPAEGKPPSKDAKCKKRKKNAASPSAGPPAPVKLPAKIQWLQKSVDPEQPLSEPPPPTTEELTWHKSSRLLSKDKLNTDSIYDVEMILGSRNVEGVSEYQVQWKGFSAKEATWEPMANLVGCQRSISEYLAGTLNGHPVPNPTDGSFEGESRHVSRVDPKGPQERDSSARVSARASSRAASKKLKRHVASPGCSPTGSSRIDTDTQAFQCVVPRTASRFVVCKHCAANVITRNLDHHHTFDCEPLKVARQEGAIPTEPWSSGRVFARQVD